MKSEILNCRQSVAVASDRFCSALQESIASLKDRLIARYTALAPQRITAIREAIAEAEEQAWETAFPHLFLPDFAELRLAAIVHERKPAYARAA